MSDWPGWARLIGMAIVAVAVLVTVTLLITIFVLTLWASVAQAGQGWYLLVPPSGYPSALDMKVLNAAERLPKAQGDQQRETILAGIIKDNRPFREWMHLGAFDTAMECEEMRTGLAERAPAGSVGKVGVTHARCIASDDPRLK